MKWTLVTGASKGLGAAICIELAKQNQNIVVHYNTNKDAADKVVEECRKKGVQAESLQGDFSSERGVNQFIDKYLARFQETAGLVNNVGNYLIKSISLTKTHEWQELFQSNFFASLHLINKLLDSLKKNRGRVVNIGTVLLGASRAFSHAPAYSICKIALYQATLSYAKELAISHVTMNMVSPGFMENSVDLEDLGKLPMQRAASLEEVAKMVAYFFTPEASYITGQNIEVAGGFGL